MLGMNVYCALQERFPRFKVTTQLENNCPQFLNMLTRICEKFDSTGRSKARHVVVYVKFRKQVKYFQGTQTKVEAARQKTEAARMSYLQSLVRSETLTELITSKEIYLYVPPSSCLYTTQVLI